MKNRLLNILKSYRLLVILSVLMVILSVDYIVLSTLADSMYKSAGQLDRKLRNLRLNETEAMLREIDRQTEVMNLPKMQNGEARDFLLEILEDFRRMYRARIKKPITETDSSYTVSIEFRYVPEHPEDLIRLFNYMKKSTAPIYNVGSVNFRYNNGVRSVVVETEMIQPFVGGSYAY